MKTSSFRECKRVGLDVGIFGAGGLKRYSFAILPIIKGEGEGEVEGGFVVPVKFLDHMRRLILCKSVRFSVARRG